MVLSEDEYVALILGVIVFLIILIIVIIIVVIDQRRITKIYGIVTGNDNLGKVTIVFDDASQESGSIHIAKIYGQGWFKPYKKIGEGILYGYFKNLKSESRSHTPGFFLKVVDGGIFFIQTYLLPYDKTANTIDYNDWQYLEEISAK